VITFGDSITVNLGRGAIKDELLSCEWGSYEDHIRMADCPTCGGAGRYGTCSPPDSCIVCGGEGKVEKREEPYDKGRLHIVELIERDKSKSRVYLKTEEEVNEFFVHACTGTFGLYHLSTLKRIYKELAPYVDAKTKARVPEGSLGY